MSLSSDERDILQGYSHLNLPRHTSYPPVSYWVDDESEARKRFRSAVLGKSNGFESSGLAPEVAEIYVHVPFCEQLCLYCACNRMTLPRSSDRTGLVSRVVLGIEREAKALEAIRGLSASRIHFGGGTPNYLCGAELKRLMDAIRGSLNCGPDTQFSIELDARQLKLSFLSALKDTGFRIASLGVQDLDADVQRRIGRVQSVDLIREATNRLREYHITNINFDLIYGLPGQTLQTWMSTLETCVQMLPSRFSLFRFAMIPELYPWQKSMVAGVASVPDPVQTAEMFLMARDFLDSEGYVYLGLDHFAKASDPLAKAFLSRGLGRSFQGVVEKERVQIIGLGPSAVSFFRGVYSQREKDIKKWLNAHDQDSGHLDVLTSSMVRYFELSSRDWSRFRTIQEIYSSGFVSDLVLAEEDESFALHRTSPLRNLYIQQGILLDDQNGIRLSDRLGKLLSRLIASHFDDYFSKEGVSKGNHSKAF